jgi:hypothetical protein
MTEHTRPAQPKKVDREAVKRFIADVLGFDPDTVTKIVTGHDAIYVTEQLRNADGEKYVIGTPADPAVYLDDVPNIGEVAERTVKVRLSQPLKVVG